MLNVNVKVIKMVLKVYSEISFSKSMYIISTSQLICIEIQLPGFYLMQAFAERFLRIDFKTAVVLWMHLGHNLGMVSVF